MVELLLPKSEEITTLDGDVKTYIISRFPATVGREIIAKYPLSAMPKLGDYAVNEETMFKLMAHVGVMIGDNVVALSTKAMVNNHVPEWETLARIELAMIKYNTSFFRDGVVSTFSSGIAQKVIALITPTLTRLLPQLLDQAKQRFKN